MAVPQGLGTHLGKNISQPAKGTVLQSCQQWLESWIIPEEIQKKRKTLFLSC